VTRRSLESAAVSLVSVLVRPLPRRAALRLGAGLGRLLAALDGRHVAIACDNLRRAFPDWTEERVATTARAVYAHFGRMLLDILWMQGRPAREILSFVDFQGVENALVPLREKRGVLFCTGHLGNWEIHAVAHAWVHGPVHVVARPLDNPALDARLCAFRTSSGNTVIYKRKALAQMIRALRAGQGVAVLLDQNVQESDGIFVDFFGRPAATTTVAAALAAKTGCALVPVNATMGVDGRYTLVYEPAIVWTPTGDRALDVAGVTQEIAHRTEAWIRRTPEQWLWMHRRWKTRPPGEAGPGPAAR
jgi:KDO2-lipid IV(A) lauroyltransferase